MLRVPTFWAGSAVGSSKQRVKLDRKTWKMAHYRRKGTRPALSHPPGQGRSATMKTAGHASVQCRSGRFPHPESPPFCKALVDCRNWVGSAKWGKVVRQTRTAREREAVSLLKAIEDASRLPTERLPQAVKRQQSDGLGRRPGDCRRFCAKRRGCRVRTGAASGRGFMLLQV